MFPTVPFHALPALHDEVKHDMPRAYTGLWDVCREMIPALIRQRGDPTYYVPREVPAQG